MTGARVRVGLRVAGVVALVILGLVGRAEARATLVGAVPGEGQVLGEPPREVVLEYSEDVEPRMATVSLLDGDGRIVRGTRLERRGPRRLALVLPSLPRESGKYYLKATVASARDYQLTDSLYSFEVRMAGATGPATGPETGRRASRGTSAPLVAALVALVAAGAVAALLAGRGRREAGRS